MSRKMWGAVLVLGVVMIPIGVVWMAYAITQSDSSASRVSGSDAVWPIVAFFVAFIGGTLVTVGSLGFIFRWMNSDDDDSRFDLSPSETIAQAVPKTRVGWGGDATEG
jgi:hypothetical protein